MPGAIRERKRTKPVNWWCSAQGEAWNWAWQAYPGVWLFIAAVAGSYAWTVRRLTPQRFAGDDRPTTVGEIALFSLGVLVLWLGADWPVGKLAAGYLLSAKTFQYLMFVLVAPPLLLLGTPRWFLRRLLRGQVAFRIARFLTRPLLPLAVFNTVLIASHLPPVVDGLGGSQLGSFAVDLAVIG
jgi:putative membrane protein